MTWIKTKLKYLLAFLTLFILMILVTIKIFQKPELSPPPPSLPQPMETILTPVPQQKEDCEANGGRWGKIGFNPQERCNLPTKDTGRECLNSSECEGSCLADLSPEQKSQVIQNSITTKGKCSSWKINIGCLAFVDKGKVNGITCLD